jgi:hypothetical protein
LLVEAGANSAPAFFLYTWVGLRRLWLIVAFVVLSSCLSACADTAANTGVLRGQLKIFSPKEVELGDGDISTASANLYAKYPLVVLSADGKKQIATFTADQNGTFRVELPAGEYMLDVKDRVRKHVRAKPQKFKVTAGQKVSVNLELDTGIR